ncbi:hypothetical protein J6590_102191 [Homalodisca vitripennis]|nr:hypothetical protein J6590_102191 [Homalodisca vitripennis]
MNLRGNKVLFVLFAGLRLWSLIWSYRPGGIDQKSGTEQADIRIENKAGIMFVMQEMVEVKANLNHSWKRRYYLQSQSR